MTTPLNNIQDFFTHLPPTPSHYLTTIHNKRLWIKRDDMNDSEIQGNKLRKLKAILLTAALQQRALLSFGGAYSNHIAALAAAGKRFDLTTLGVIRGEELADPNRQNATLKTAQANGMQLHFVSRSEYRHKAKGKTVQQLTKDNPTWWIIPEGGSNQHALVGTSNIIDEIVTDKTIPTPDTLFCACGTGATLAGILQGAVRHGLHDMRVVGVPVLKGADFLYDTIRAFNPRVDNLNWSLQLNAHAGGYGKTPSELLTFIAWFQQTFAVPLEPIYTGKLCHAVFTLAKQSDSKAEDWLIYHSGGLQGNQ